MLMLLLLLLLLLFGVDWSISDFTIVAGGEVEDEDSVSMLVGGGKESVEAMVVGVPLLPVLLPPLVELSPIDEGLWSMHVFTCGPRPARGEQVSRKLKSGSKSAR